MQHRFLVLASVAAFAVAAHAQAPEAAAVGKLADVSGSVLVSSGGQVSPGVHGTALAAKSMITTGSGAKATVVLNDACVIPLKANQQLVLDPKLTCAKQFAAVSQLAAPYRLAQAPIGGTGSSSGGAGAGVGLGTSLAVAGGILAVGFVAIGTSDTIPVSGK